MSISVGTGISTQPTLAGAVQEAWEHAKKELVGIPSLIIAHAGVAYDQGQVVEELRRQIGAVPVIGGSAQGAQVNDRVVESMRFLAICVVTGVEPRMARLDDIRASAGAPEALGGQLAQELGATPSVPHTTLLYYDPLHGVNAQGLIDGLASGGYPYIYGAATGQPWGLLHKTYQYLGDHVAETGAVVCVLPGIELIADLTHGAESIGLALTVTRAEGNVIFELDHKPALDVWCEQLGVEDTRHVENSANWALGIVPPVEGIYEGLITRAPFQFDSERRCLILQAPIEAGTRVQICTRTIDAVYDGAQRMGKRLADRLEHRDVLVALGFECGARPEPFLGTALATKEICELRAGLGVETPWFGVYAWGEIAPVGNRTYFHNFTFPLCVLVTA